jgi:hypothetical protein
MRRRGLLAMCRPVGAENTLELHGASEEMKLNVASPAASRTR